uniref:Uncharacterized protein n=1 Tax=Arundo donax TaxID=35708 RepID=A0A0A8YIT2_ARUDO
MKAERICRSCMMRNKPLMQE